jgi:enoyl-CoA hydratase/carnithine racemase
MEEFNRHLIGQIKVVASYRGEQFKGELAPRNKFTQAFVTKVERLIDFSQVRQRVVESEELLQESESLVLEILNQAPLAVRMTWEEIHRGLNLTLEESTLLGADYFGLIASTEDFREGTKTFLEKTNPSFSGK